MTLDDCLQYAALHAHANRLAKIEVEEASADVRIAASGLMPYMGLSSSGNMSFGRNIDPETNTYDNKKTLYTGFGLQMSLPLFDGLVTVNNLKATKIARLRRVASARIQADEISLQVVKAFYNVSYCRAMVEQMSRQLERDSADLRSTERGLELGTKSGADVAELKAIVATDNYELSNQRSLLAKAWLTLRGAMGMELADEELDIVERDLDLESSVSRGCHPRVEEASLSVAEGSLALRTAKGAFSPRISLEGGVNTSYYKMVGAGIDAPGFGRQWRDNMGQYIGFSVSLPLFTGLGNINKLKRARLDLWAREMRLDQVKYDIERLTREAELDLRGAIDDHTAALRRLEAEETAYAAVHRKYELGSASAIELYTASSRLAAARATLEGKRIQKIISSIILYYYKGNELLNITKRN